MREVFDESAMRKSIIGYSPQMTKSILPNRSIHCCTASWSCLGCRTSAEAAMHICPVSLQSSLAELVTRSRLRSHYESFPETQIGLARLCVLSSHDHSV